MESIKCTVCVGKLRWLKEEAAESCVCFLNDRKVIVAVFTRREMHDPMDVHDVWMCAEEGAFTVSDMSPPEVVSMSGGMCSTRPMMQDPQAKR